MTEATTFIGIGTPQANPTVELEFREFYQGPVAAQVTRLTSDASVPADRLRDYLQQLPAVLDRYDTLPLAAYAFACTGSAYLLGADIEDGITTALSESHGYPVITATQAIDRELRLRKTTRLAILAPYPEALCADATNYWEKKGYDVVAVARIDIGDDTRRIYNLSDAEVEVALAEFETESADQLLLSGTGMPTIAALRRDERPMVSSNLCLAVEALRAVGKWPSDMPAGIDRLCNT